MSPQEKMLLYYLNMHTDTRGEFVVGRNDIAALLDVSTPTVVKRMENVVNLGYVNAIKKPHAIGRGNGFKWVYHLTDKGSAALMVHWEIAKELFHSHRSIRYEEALKQARIIGKKSGKIIKRSDKQLSMF